MKKPAVYVLDSDVFIAAKNAYYAFDSRVLLPDVCTQF
jgi:hypothetical protein